ncbi:MAG: type II secretion system protein [Candidatus Omnitrophica bacterium]|nr:type II secretion system protein [Candidatus Omnitrophota bacterium]
MKKRFECAEMKQSPAFTIVELMVVFIIVGAVAAFAITGYNKVMLRSEYQNSRMNLIAIHGASEIYKTKYGRYPPYASDLDTINSTLDINVTDNNYVYTYSALGSIYSAKAVRANPEHTVYLNSWEAISDSNPRCFGLCP